MTQRIPNYNTLSTLIDRLSIENVKLSHFENALEHDTPPEAESAALRKKIAVQAEIIGLLKNELTANLTQIFDSLDYDYATEERTFK